MMTHSEIAEKIIALSPDTINLIVLFGSRARGDNTLYSDLDIAVSTSLQDKRQRFELKLKIISLFEGPKLDVDVIIIEDTNWSLKYRIAKDGVVLFQRDDDSWANFIEKVMIYYPDYRLFEQKILRETLESS